MTSFVGHILSILHYSLHKQQSLSRFSGTISCPLYMTHVAATWIVGNKFTTQKPVSGTYPCYSGWFDLPCAGGLPGDDALGYNRMKIHGEKKTVRAGKCQVTTRQLYKQARLKPGIIYTTRNQLLGQKAWFCTVEK